MLLKRFKASKIYGYLNIDIKFNSDINFLIGGNGSGKTTVLRLINALLGPNISELCVIPFGKISLELIDNGENIIITATTYNRDKVISITGTNETLKIPEDANFEFKYYEKKTNSDSQLLINFENFKYENEVIKLISNIQSPIFLGLDRKREDCSRDNEDLMLKSELMREKSYRSMQAKRLFRGTLGHSLTETQLLVRESYKKMRALEERHSMRLRESILLSSFQYVSYKDLEIDGWKEKAALIERQSEIRDALANLGVKNTKLESIVDTFFQKCTYLFESLEDSQETTLIEWLLNKTQIERMSQIVEIIDDHKSTIDKLFMPIDEFLTTLNSFYCDSKKKIEVDTVGHLQIIRPNGEKCTIEALSSGERQLLVIFAQLFFNKAKSEQSVFIIDEPELSLHLSWQEKFAETIMSFKQKFQFIFATHSPEIIGEFKNKAICCK